ncbi:MAG: UDP-N-acetylmuramoyl-L-alanyl-D-glutamate--2,6-diaminopimelate ligase [Vicingaceae bacterium]
MKQLKDILYGASIIEVIGSTSVKLANLCFDSRKVKEGDCFFALKGTQVDGHQFIDQVIASGAKAIVCESMPEQTLDSVVYVKVRDSSEALAHAAANFYNHPSKKMKVVGITGTNGKTTCVTLLFNLFRKLGYKVGLVSTVVNKIGDKEVPATHTTPDALQLNELFAQMVIEGCTHCFMEVSSHALAQHRVTAVSFAGGVFTNITHEHLDFHKTFKEYIKAKQMLFSMLPKGSFALSNKDDKNGPFMLQETVASKNYYALKTQADFKAKVLESNFTGLNLQLDGKEFWSPLIGYFNAYNLLAIYSTAVLLGESKVEVLTVLSSLQAVAGRFQYINLHQIAGIVDYAHSPDALENVLKTIKGIRGGNEQVITVVGCGGDRDTSKRPIMAKIACQLSDRVILTSDNPRTEDPQTIIEDMKTGVEVPDRRKTLAIVQRREAIRTASSLAQAGDIILVAGKGHETYQEINGERNHFDDLEELTQALNENHQTKA